MQVKDALQALVDDSLLRVEKIGSGNWYWSFVGDERKRLEGSMKSLGEEKEGLKRVVEGIKDAIGRERERIRREGGGEDVSEFLAIATSLKKEKGNLEAQLEDYKDGDPTEVERRRGLISKNKAAVNRTTGENGLDQIWVYARQKITLI